ncbi:MAG: biotin--[acetyl-CoA-carboxylase] ligase [Gemmatimonadetes bacterium]|nr:biotin--[acetyl-CoA-carboxylase] ligase [Gemmatimonadota bacterium]
MSDEVGRPQAAPDAAALTAPSYAARIGAASVVVLPEVDSTMDEAHRLARGGAPAGTVVVADLQRHGRGRGGRVWESGAGDGVWMTLLERPEEPGSVPVLSLRVGLALAAALSPFADAEVRVKWPNDLLVAGRKLAGILVEARWHGATLDWVALGVGVNRVVPAALADRAAAVRAGTPRAVLVAALVPAMRRAASSAGPLTAAECAAWEACDALRGVRIAEPAPGVVEGITASGALRVRQDDGGLLALQHGSVLVAE